MNVSINANPDVNMLSFYTSEFGVTISSAEGLDKAYEIFCKIMDKIKELEMEGD